MEKNFYEPLFKKTYDGFVETYVLDCDNDIVFEFERIGYFKLAYKDENDIPYFLCIVNLK
jgi:hypothetical protein